MQVEGEINLPQALEEETYRIAVEALNNALKHAAANCVEVALCRGRDGFELTVADDGVGFDVAAAGERGGLGLSTMQERAAALGGRLQVISAPHEGTRVHLKVDNKV